MRNLVFFTLFLFLNSCDSLDSKLNITNHSDKDMFYQTMFDTILNANILIEPLPDNDTIKVGIIGGEGTWEYKIQKRSADSTLYIFVFFDSKVTNEIINEKKYFVKGFKINELDTLGWIVSFPENFK